MKECSKLPQKEYKTTQEWVGKVIDWEVCKKLKLDHTTKRYKTGIRSGEWDVENSLGSWDTNGSPNSDHKTKPSICWQKKRFYRIVDFLVAADHVVKIKESEKID